MGFCYMRQWVYAGRLAMHSRFCLSSRHCIPYRVLLPGLPVPQALKAGSSAQAGTLVAQIQNEGGEGLRNREGPVCGQDSRDFAAKDHIQQGTWAVLPGMRHDLA